MESRVCIVCSAVFYKKYCTSKREWAERYKCCSKKCADSSRRGRIASEETKAKQRAWSTGRKHTPEAIAKMSGQNCRLWKGGLEALRPKCLGCGCTVPNAKAHRCHPCKAKFQVGENAANWQGGITPQHKKIRNSKEYAAWRTAVFERDNYACVECCARGGTLNADHIKPFAAFPELRLDVSNGRTLCVPCHKKTDTFKGKAKRFMRRLEGTQQQPTSVGFFSSGAN